jgi:hypothetical protein
MKSLPNYKDADTDFNWFADIYRRIHPEIFHIEKVGELKSIYDDILDDLFFITFSLDRIKNESTLSAKAHRFQIQAFEHRKLFTKNKNIWLVFNKNLSIDDSLAEFIINKDNVLLSSADYTLLFYVSLEEDVDVKKNLEGLPLSMLREMYDPLIEDAIDEWADLLDFDILNTKNDLT